MFPMKKKCFTTPINTFWNIFYKYMTASHFLNGILLQEFTKSVKNNT